MSFASQSASGKRNNDALIRNKRFFDFQQETIQRFFLKGSKKRLGRKKLTAKQIQLIRMNLVLDKRMESLRKIFVFAVSIMITLLVLFLIVYIFTKYVF